MSRHSGTWEADSPLPPSPPSALPAPSSSSPQAAARSDSAASRPMSHRRRLLRNMGFPTPPGAGPCARLRRGETYGGPLSGDPRSGDVEVNSGGRGGAPLQGEVDQVLAGG